MPYLLSIDQSTSGTKAMLFDADGKLTVRCDLPHRQIVNESGWVEHDVEEIYRNTLAVAALAVKKAGIDPAEIAGIGISNQRETAAVWDRATGKPLAHAVVWQCPRGEAICREIEASGHGEEIRRITGLKLSPYFSAAKFAWLLNNVPAVRRAAQAGTLCCGTMDSYLVFRLTGGRAFKTDYSNASRTQLYDIRSLCWSRELCGLFGLSPALLPEVCDSDAPYGETDLNGLLPRPVPIHGVIGDSQGALFGQGCLKPGMAKATYGTGSSVMMNTGGELCVSGSGAVTSLAWGIGGKVQYVLEGNVNYTGSVIKWIAEDLGLLDSVKDASGVAQSANPADETYLVPAFTGLGAPYWDSGAKAAVIGMSRTTGRAELVRAAEECIAYQITDVANAMLRDAGGLKMEALCADGGPTRDSFLMQFQSDILGMEVSVSSVEELSGAGAAYLAGIGLGLYKPERLFQNRERKSYYPVMEREQSRKKYDGWLKAVGRVLSKQE